MTRAFFTAALALLLLGPAHAADEKKTEADLGRIRREIAGIQATLAKETTKRDALAAKLRDAELGIAEARRRLEAVRAERAQSEQRRAALEAEKAESERKLASEREGLAGELRAAYTVGRDEQLKLILNQQEPARLGRMLAYYGYLGRSRAERIASIRAELERLVSLNEALDVELARLRDLEEQAKAQLDAVQRGRRERSRVVEQLEQRIKSRGAKLARLKREESTLEKLLEDLRRVLPDFPTRDEPFEKLKGKLRWPVAGKVVEGFGRNESGGLHRNGVLLSSERGAKVHAIHFGRVIYADWLPGMGLLTIIEHGNGYLSLYGHNDQLFKSVGDWVAPGDVIATVGDSGGRSRTGLYFEIRKGSRPLDPGQWIAKGSSHR